VRGEEKTFGSKYNYLKIQDPSLRPGWQHPFQRGLDLQSNGGTGFPACAGAG